MQNGQPVLQNLRLTNDSDAPLREIVCSFASDEGLVVPGEIAFREIAPGGTAERPDPGVLLNGRRLLEVHDEPVAGTVRLTVTVQGETVLGRSYPVTMLPTDQWPGVRPYAELLAAYVLPNADLVRRLQAEAAKIVERNTGDAALQGYQGGKKRVLEICAAIYGAVQALGLRYSQPPASFGQPGQKIRLPAEIEKFKLATCLETSLLMAAVLERCELHPVLVLTENHCYVGCHLVAETSAEVVTREIRPLRKRADLDEFVAIETTKATTDAPFGEAEKTGRAHLAEEADFVCAIDVVRSRESGIRSIPYDEGFDADYRASGRDVDVSDGTDVRTPQESVDLAALQQARTTQGRIDRWTQKLLDFSARNRLLNIPKTSRQVIRLMCGNVAALEDKIAANKTVVIRSVADTMGEKALDDLSNGRMAQEDCAKIVDAELGHGRLCVMMPPREVHRRLSDLLHDARTDLEESGVNTLFLTLGELQWMEPGGGAGRKAYRAPVLMVPVRLERASMAEGVKMFRLDEETTLNTTLVEFLRTQFGLSVPGLDPLPTDETGVDVARVLRILRQAVRDKAGWEVFDTATVGCFSFGKFVMWKDMTERVGDLKKSPLVNHLIGGGGLFEDGVEVFPPAEVAAHVRPGELFCPVSYDASQLTAVLYSEMGKSFVLHGPPGTGKSQTITNIIAHNLAKGRRVLFVSEKKAALDVVKERLDRIGLRPFCLELHSNKTEKSRFYGQIKDALEVPETSLPDEWDEVVAACGRCRGELNGYIEALHRTYPNGLTPYACFSQAIAGTAPARPELLDVDCLAQTRADYIESRKTVQDLLNDLHGVSRTALRVTPQLKTDAWNPLYERQLKTAVEAVVAAEVACEEPFKALREPLSLEEDWTQPAVEKLADVLEAVRTHPQVPRRFVAPGVRNTSALLAELSELRTRRQACAEELGGYRLEALAALDFDGLERRLAENAQAFCLVRFFRNRALLKELAGIAKLGGTPLTVRRLGADLPRMRSYVNLGKTFAEKAGSGPDDLVEADGGLLKRAAAALERWRDLRARLAELDAFVDGTMAEPDLRVRVAGYREFLANLDDVRNVMRYRGTKARAQALGLGRFADVLAETDGGAREGVAAFDDAYAARMLNAVLAREPVLAAFTGLNQDARVEKFRELDAQYADLSRRMVYAKLAASLPRRRNGPCPEGTELGMIKRECEKKTRQKAVRQMLAESKILIPALKPCFLMSPLSVAQYLPVDAAPFDLIVFDEASQIPVWDAIGVIARGRQLIVVGDPKQMPPTNFFRKGDAEAEDDEPEETIADQESILDECLVAGVFSTYLNWHYRSRHEALIAFSNEHYYANKLCTFPSALSSPRLGMKFMFVPGGVFTKVGKGPRVNEVEAKALVDYICDEVRKPGYRRRSLGVVTFSMPQQKLIRTMLEERRGADPDLERLLPEDGEGAYFVKNLENVQGDESDVILFSVGYAPDENGRFTMNFGPLNLAGGERRLNVAVTRAREQVVVFSSIRGSQIDAGENGRTKAVGASHLKAFLEYAERGNAVAASVPAAAGANGKFCDVVAAFLSGKGYTVDRNVGYSDDRVDIAVAHPDESGRYVMGIECDGPDYAGQRTAKDRDVNRAGVLRGLGWNTCRVWSVDWALDRARAERRLLEALETACRTPQGTAPAPKRPEPRPEPVPAPRKTAAVRPAKAPVLDRALEEIPSAELRDVMQEILRDFGACPRDALYRETLRRFGLTRLTAKARGYLDIACAQLQVPPAG